MESAGWGYAGEGAGGAGSIEAGRGGSGARVPRAPGGRGGGPSQEGGVRSPQPPCGEGLQEFRGAEGLPEPGGPRPLLLGSGSHPPAGELVSLEPLHVVASVAATVLSPFPRLRAPHWPTQLSPLASSSAEQAQLPDGRGRPRCTRTLPALRFLGILLC